MNNGLVEFRAVAADAVVNCSPRRQSQVPRKVPKNDAAKSLCMSLTSLVRGFNKRPRRAVMPPHIMSTARPERCLIKDASRAGIDMSAYFEKITLAAQETAASKLYSMPLTETTPLVFSMPLVDNAIAIPAITRMHPVQDLIDKCSLRNTTANSMVSTGITVVISIAMLGFSLDKAMKKNVSPSDIPNTPLMIKKNNVWLLTMSKPVLNNKTPIHTTATMFLPIFIPTGDTLLPISL